MKIPQDARFRHERARFALRFGCEDCAMFAPGEGRARDARVRPEGARSRRDGGGSHGRGAPKGPALARGGGAPQRPSDLLEGDCAHGYPTDEHREARYDDPEALLVFCKEWESA